MWKQIPNFENYLCSTDGQFMRNNKLLKVAQHKSGYANIRLYKDGQPTTFRAHRVIFMTFVREIPLGYEINHKNGIKNDNRLCNLEMCTHSQNLHHAINKGLQKIKYGAENKNSIPIYAVHIQSGEVLHFSSQADAKRQGFNQGNIQSVLRGKRTKHKDFKWFYA